MTGYPDIILIDDDPIFNFINTEIIELAKPGFVIHAFDKVQNALEEISNTTRYPKGDFNTIIFVDINMPILNGWDFLERFSKLSPSILNSFKVFMLSSSNDISDIETSKSYNVVKGFISKPLTEEHVFAICNVERASTGFLTEA